MSAIAATRLEDKLIMMSDGRASKCGEVVSKEYPKVQKVNKNIGFFWLGTYPKETSLKEMQKYLQSQKKSGISDFSIDVSWFLKRIYSPIMDTFNLVDKDRFIFIMLNGNGQYYGWDSDRDQPFEPVEKSMTMGGCLYFGHDKQPTDGDQYKGNTQKYINAGLDPVQACTKGFKKLMKELSEEGRLVGGKVFTEVLQVPKLSPFRQALQN